MILVKKQTCWNINSYLKKNNIQQTFDICDRTRKRPKAQTLGIKECPMDITPCRNINITIIVLRPYEFENFIINDYQKFWKFRKDANSILCLLFKLHAYILETGKFEIELFGLIGKLKIISHIQKVTWKVLGQALKTIFVFVCFDSYWKIVFLI